MRRGSRLIRRQARRASPHRLTALAAAAHRHTISSHPGLWIHYQIRGRSPLFGHAIQFPPALRTPRGNLGGDHFLRSLLRSCAESEVPLPRFPAGRFSTFALSLGKRHRRTIAGTLQPLDFLPQLLDHAPLFADQTDQFFPAEICEGRFGGQALAPVPPVYGSALRLSNIFLAMCLICLPSFLRHSLINYKVELAPIDIISK